MSVAVRKSKIKQNRVDVSLFQAIQACRQGTGPVEDKLDVLFGRQPSPNQCGLIRAVLD
jgi:hypothetical protein